VTAAAELSGEQRSVIAAAVQRVDGVLVSTDLARVLVHWLGQLAKAQQRNNGCASSELVAAQNALAEACFAAGHCAQRESERAAAAEILISGHEDMHVSTAEAAAALGITANGVRWLCGQGRLSGRKVGRQVMVTASSVEDYKQRKARSA
jgi:Helix-turn-helix domain